MADNIFVITTRDRGAFRSIRPAEYRLYKTENGEIILQGLFLEGYDDGEIYSREWIDIPTVGATE
jgi:hypothetical protein